MSHPAQAGKVPPDVQTVVTTRLKRDGVRINVASVDQLEPADARAACDTNASSPDAVTTERSVAVF